MDGQHEATTQDHFLSNQAYDVLKFIAQIFLPAFGTLYFTLASIWGLPSAEEVVGTIMASDAFLGVLLSLTTKSYNNSDAKYDGQINVVQQEDFTKQFMLELNSDPNEPESKSQIVFKVNPS